MFYRRRNLASSGRKAVCVLALAATATLHGQEALRMSLASEDAARERRLANTTLGYYNLKFGPTAWRFSSALGMEWNDNIRLNGIDPLSDFIFRPELDARMLWPVTEKNALNLRLGAGYSAYVEHPEYSRFFVRPGSELSFDIYTGNFTINLHDRFSILEDSYLDPTVVGNADYSRLENAFGATTLWDMNKLLVRFGYDHVNYVSLNDSASVPDGSSEVGFLSGGCQLGNIAMAGLESGGGVIDYTTSTRPDAAQWNAGVFGESQFSEYIVLRASGGYMVYSPDTPEQTTDDDFSGMYLQFSARHRINKYLRYDLSAGRSFNFQFYGGTVDSWFVRWAGTWNILHNYSLLTTVDYQNGEELDYDNEQFQWIGGGFSLRRQITQKLSAGAGYRIYSRNSNLPSREYVVNTVSLNLRYDF